MKANERTTFMRTPYSAHRCLKYVPQPLVVQGHNPIHASMYPRQLTITWLEMLKRTWGTFYPRHLAFFSPDRILRGSRHRLGLDNTYPSPPCAAARSVLGGTRLATGGHNSSDQQTDSGPERDPHYYNFGFRGKLRHKHTVTSTTT